jgi:hypothetical protein
VSNRSSKFPLTDTRVAAVHAPHFYSAPTHAPTMHLATQNATSLPPTILYCSHPRTHNAPSYPKCTKPPTNESLQPVASSDRLGGRL